MKGANSELKTKSVYQNNGYHNQSEAKGGTNLKGTRKIMWQVKKSFAMYDIFPTVKH